MAAKYVELNNAVKELGVKFHKRGVCPTGDGEKAGHTSFTLILEADIMDSERDRLSKEKLRDVLYVRFQSHFEFVFDEDRIAGKYKIKMN